jgi:hypothetical protein
VFKGSEVKNSRNGMDMMAKAREEQLATMKQLA